MSDKKSHHSSPTAADQLTADTTNIADEHSGGLPGRIGIWTVGGVLMVVALLAMKDFGDHYFLSTPEREGNSELIKAWVFGHLVRGVGMAILSWQLFQYAVEVGKVKTADDLPALSRRHGTMWCWGAIVFVVLSAYNVVTQILM